MAAGSNSMNPQPGQPVFVAGTRVGIQAIPENARPRVVVPGTRVGIQAIPENARPRVVVPMSAGTQPPTRQCVVARPLDRLRVATNSPSPETVST